ncbi:hydroxyacylglutathione hydrolase [Chromatium weissei]|nr:hydroxyacylglutathione hydrolase [Chromatium weissei]
MLQVRPLLAFTDNYIWLLTDGSGNAAVIDPGDAKPVFTALAAERLNLTAIVLTHHHRDHIGGVDALQTTFPTVRVYGPNDSRIPQVTERVNGGDHLQLFGLDANFEVLAVPGHTSTHVAYVGAGRLFCGDTLFAAGCGRVFDGTFAQLATSLAQFAALPKDTQCYCAHEYTLNNLGFAQWVEPNSAAIAARLISDQTQREMNTPTVPSSLALELATNPFLRTNEPQVITAAERAAGQRLNTPIEVFTALRQWKDREYD